MDVDDDTDIRATLGDGTAGDLLAKAVARSRVASKLFAVFEPVTFGRYQLLERVGAGGIGVVWGAWDPTLERRVAIKVLRPTIARDRVLVEGQALARLSDPNVVPVFDVGVVEDQVYLVMEWVRGETLRAYCAGRDVREIVDAYRQAGAGLLAAHRANIIHRDFKPDNAIVGADGRVRVLDFGLSASAGGSGDRDGTPRYRAPEQARGEPPAFAMDQYAFAVSLREALEARGEVPRWLAAIIARGAADDPAARYPSLAELVRDLGRDPARRWRRRIIAGVAIGAAITAFAIGRVGGGPAACSGSEQELAASWSPATRIDVVARLRALGAFGASAADLLAADLDARGAEWIELHRSSCLAHERGELTTELYERRLACLVRTRAGLAAAVDVLRSASRDTLNDAVVAARSSPRPASCESAAEPARPPPAVASRVDAIAQDIARTRVLGVAARPGALEAARRASADARTTGYLPLVVSALLVEGRLAADLDPPRSSVPLEEALVDAIAIADDALTVEAFARLAFARSRQENAAIDGISLIEPIARRAGDSARFARALLHNNLGVMQLTRGDRAAARARFVAALDDWRPNGGDGDLELATIPLNLALVVDRPAEGAELAERGAATLERLLGANHANTLNARVQAGLLMPDRAAARARLRDVCARYATWQPQLAAERASCNFELGLIEEELGDHAAALAAMRLAAADPWRDRRAVGELAAAFIAPDTDPHQLAARAAVLAARDGWWNKFEGGDAYLIAALASHDPATAKANRAAAHAIYAAIGLPIFHGRLAWTAR